MRLCLVKRLSYSEMESTTGRVPCPVSHATEVPSDDRQHAPIVSTLHQTQHFGDQVSAGEQIRGSRLSCLLTRRAVVRAALEGDYVQSCSNADVVRAVRAAMHPVQSSLSPPLKQLSSPILSTIEFHPAPVQSTLARPPPVPTSAASRSSSRNGKDNGPEPATLRSVQCKPNVKKCLVLPVGLAKTRHRPSTHRSHRHLHLPPTKSTTLESASDEHAMDSGQPVARLLQAQYARPSTSGPSFLTRLFRRPSPSTASPFIHFKERRPLHPVVTVLHAEAVMSQPKHPLPLAAFLRDTAEELEDDDDASDPENTIQVSPRLATIKLEELARRTRSTQARDRRHPHPTFPQRAAPLSVPSTSRIISPAVVDTQPLLTAAVEPLHWAMPTSPKTTRQMMIEAEIPATLRLELLRHRILGRPVRHT